MKTLVYQTWSESEQGWGIRPDGFSLHLSMDDHTKYMDDYWSRMPKSTPHEYSFPDGLDRRYGHPYILEVDGRSALYRSLAKSKTKFGLRFWQHERLRTDIQKQLDEALKNKEG